MTPERWKQIRTLFDQALDLAPSDRVAFLDEACQGDEDARAQVEALLRKDAATPALLDASLSELAALLPKERSTPLETDRVGSYRLIEEIGRGGMGTVYLAERDDDQYRRRVALKLVKRGMDTEEILHRFRYERQILATLEHPHIARLYDGGMSDDGRPYLAMEYVDGQTINAYCDAKTLSVDERLNLFQTVCEAVQYAHQNLIVHRDLKPSNILVTEEGQVKLLDFGIAKLLHEEAEEPAPVTRTGMRVMTPEYAAPEQVQGAVVTTATDVYALGVILYELLTGRRPHEAIQHNSVAAERTVPMAEPERPSTVVTKPSARRRRDGIPGMEAPEAISAARARTVDQLQRRHLARGARPFR